MRRRRHLRRWAASGVVAMALMPGMASAEGEPAAPRGDRIWPTSDDVTARVQRGFAFFGPVTIERRDEAATGNGRESADTVPLPPPSVVVVSPEAEPAPRFEPAAPAGLPAAYAPSQPAPLAAIDRAMGKVIAAPMPRRRPTPPVAQPSEESADAPLPPTSLRVATLEPMPVERPSSARETATEEPIVAEEPIVGEPRRIPREALPYLAILKREAAANKVPLWLAIGVGWVESKYDPKLRGSHGVVGLMQVMPSTARFQGYRGTSEQLLDAETNIVWGMRELGWDYAKSGGNACLAIAKYKGGIATRSIPSAAASYCAAAKRATGMI